MLGDWCACSQGVVNGRASHADRRLLVAGKMSGGRLVYAAPGVDVDGVDNIVGHLAVCCQVL